MPKSSIKNDLVIDNNTSVVKAGKENIISIRFNIEGFIPGISHPYHYHRVINYDLETGEKLELSELFQPEVNYLQALSDYSSELLSNRLSNKEWILKGTAPTNENFMNWNLKKKRIINYLR